MALNHFCCVLTATTFLTASIAQAGPVTISQPPPAQGHAPAGKPGNAVLDDPYLVACLNALGHGELSRGVELCSLALLVNPKDPDALELRGYGFLLQQRFDKAEEDFRAVLQIRPDSAEDLAGYGRSLTGLGDFSGAVTQLAKAVDLDPRNAAYRNALCWARASDGKNLDMALGDCDTALMLAPGTAEPLNSHGLVNLRLGRYSAAIADYTSSLAARSTQPSARFGRGLAYLALGQIAAGSVDILAARAGDSDIDSMFIQMGVLPRDCGVRQDAKCPTGFPSPQKGSWMAVQWRFWR